MSKIKLRKRGKDIKRVEKTLPVGQRMKNACLQTKKQASIFLDESSESPDEYAETIVDAEAHELVRDTVSGAVQTVKITAKKGRGFIRTRQDRIPKQWREDLKQEKRAEDSVQKPQTEQFIRKSQGKDSGVEVSSVLYSEKPSSWTSAPTLKSQSLPVQEKRFPDIKTKDRIIQIQRTETGNAFQAKQPECWQCAPLQQPLSIRTEKGAAQPKAVEQRRRFAVKQMQKRKEKEIRLNQPMQTVRTVDRPATSAARDIRRQSPHVMKNVRKQARNETIGKPVKTVKGTKRCIKSVKYSGKGTITTTNRAVRGIQTAIPATVKHQHFVTQVQAVGRTARNSAVATRGTKKATVKAILKEAHATREAMQAFTSALIAGGWFVMLIVVILCMIGMIAGSSFGIFFSSQDTGSQPMSEVIREIDEEYNARIDEIKASANYDELEMTGARASWKDVLTVYAVKVTTDRNDPQEVASMDDAKKARLKAVFWDMNPLTYSTTSSSHRKTDHYTDENGIRHTEHYIVTTVTLHISVSGKSAEEMAIPYGFDDNQCLQLRELLASGNDVLWASVLYGIPIGSGSGDNNIVSIALSQVGNIGGEPYWSWYGFTDRVEWCACFVSWCANECGYINSGVIPKFVRCTDGVSWFRNHNQWAENDIEPIPGTIIFFDWDNKGSAGDQDGRADHVGIVERVENGRVYTIEGNSSDGCRERSYSIGYYEILGYGLPLYN